MNLVKKTAEYTIFERNDKRYAVRAKNRKWINGEDKLAILNKEGLVKKPAPPKKAEPEPADEGEGKEAS